MTWSKEVLFTDGDDFFDSVLNAIEHAKHQVQIEMYIFELDEIGQRFHQALMTACRRGLKVQILVDGFGASHWIDAGSNELILAGAEIRVYHPPFFISFEKFIKKLFRFPLRVQIPRYFIKMNRRDHRKLIIVDQQTTWVGSMNLVSHHSFKIRGQFSWLDIGVQVEGEFVAKIVESFNRIWNLARPSVHQLFAFHKSSDFDFSHVRLNETFKARAQSNQLVIDKISSAKKLIQLINPYFSPTLRFLKAIQFASRNGITVELLLPEKSDVFFMPWVATAYYNSLLKSGVIIYEYPSKFIHAKAIIVDDWAIVGTSNLNRRSMTLDLEIDLVIFAEKNLIALKSHFSKLKSESKIISARLPTMKSILGKIILFFLEPFI